MERVPIETKHKSASDALYEDEKSEDGTYPENVLKNPAGCVGKTEKHKSRQARLFWQAVRMRKYRTK